LGNAMTDRDNKPSNHPTRILGDTRVERAAAKPAGVPACLIFIAGERVGHKVSLRPGRLEVGRDPASEITLVSDLVSRNHARLVVGAEQALLVDLGSTNGTYVNDRRVRDRILQDGDRISFGQVVVKYLAQGNAEAAYHDEVFRLVSHDGLTEVYNRRYFDEQFGIRLQSNTAVGLLLLDADHFKRVNDTFGHGGGDAVLRTIARTVAERLPEPSFVARIGGEEFAVLTWSPDPEVVAVQCRELAELVRSAIAATAVEFGEQTIAVTVSVGVAWASPAMSHEYSQEALLRLADERLYQAKQEGRNRVCGAP
jgi:two-component system, cell cycle response regulator